MKNALKEIEGCISLDTQNFKILPQNGTTRLRESTGRAAKNSCYYEGKKEEEEKVTGWGPFTSSDRTMKANFPKIFGKILSRDDRCL